MTSEARGAGTGVPPVFRDRTDAGDRLGLRFRHRTAPDVLVVGLGRGGVPVARRVADRLGAPMDLLGVRRLSCPWQPEVTVGAVVEDGPPVLDTGVLRRLGMSAQEAWDLVRIEQAALAARLRRWRDGRPRASFSGRTVAAVDDGLSTGSVARAAGGAIRQQGARSAMVAAPVGAAPTITALRGVADEVYALAVPRRFGTVGAHYARFAQVRDDEVRRALGAQGCDQPQAGPGAGSATPQPTHVGGHEITIHEDRLLLPALLEVPPGTSSLVVVAHAASSRRFSATSRSLVGHLAATGLGTIVVDLLTADEADDRAAVFDVERLARRLSIVLDWVQHQERLWHLDVGIVASGTAAAGAVSVAARSETTLSGLVLADGRPDLAGPDLARVTAPTLLLVGALDPIVSGLARQASRTLGGRSQVVEAPRAHGTLRDPETVAQAAALSRAWLTMHAAPRPTTRRPNTTSSRWSRHAAPLVVGNPGS